MRTQSGGQCAPSTPVSRDVVLSAWTQQGLPIPVASPWGPGVVPVAVPPPRPLPVPVQPVVLVVVPPLPSVPVVEPLAGSHVQSPGPAFMLSPVLSQTATGNASGLGCLAWGTGRTGSGLGPGTPLLVVLPPPPLLQRTPGSGVESGRSSASAIGTAASANTATGSACVSDRATGTSIVVTHIVLGNCVVAPRLCVSVEACRAALQPAMQFETLDHANCILQRFHSLLVSFH